MKKLIISALAILAIGQAAFAADISRPRVQTFDPPVIQRTWTGAYVGANFGYGNSYDDRSISGTDALTHGIVASGVVPGSLSDRAHGWLGGVQVGYNWQINRMVLGVEADADWSGLRGSDSQTITAAPLGIPLGITTSADWKNEWLATVRGRVGYLVNDGLMAFATGGLAVGQVKGNTSAVLTTPGPTFTASEGFSKTKFGWTVGGGVEGQLSSKWTWKAEYLYVDLGDRSGQISTVVGGTPVAFDTRQDFTQHIVRVGLNYHF
jgi:outer membrane immunogenic protein